MRRTRYAGDPLVQAIEFYKGQFTKSGYFVMKKLTRDRFGKQYSTTHLYHYQDVMADAYGQIDIYGREVGQVGTLRFPVEQVEPIDIEEAERFIKVTGSK